MDRPMRTATLPRAVEAREKILGEVEERLPPPDGEDPLQPGFRRLDAIQ
jgi:hypothetical protein